MQVLETGPFDGADMDEHISAAPVRLNEPKALGRIEPFQGHAVDTGPLVAFVKEIGGLNRRAASWTAVAEFPEGLATIAHYYAI